MKKREKQKVETIEKIIHSAYCEYCLRGFQVSTAQIAKNAGVSHGLIFSYFKTAEELMIEVVERYAYMIAGEIREYTLAEYKTDLCGTSKF